MEVLKKRNLPCILVGVLWLTAFARQMFIETSFQQAGALFSGEKGWSADGVTGGSNIRTVSSTAVLASCSSINLFAAEWCPFRYPAAQYANGHRVTVSTETVLGSSKQWLVESLKYRAQS